jgi:hypothetical protein
LYNPIFGRYAVIVANGILECIGGCMIDNEKIIASAEEPMRDFCKSMKHSIGDWEPYIRVSEKILNGEEVSNDEVQPEMQFMVDWSKLIMTVTRHGQWDWTRPEVQEIYKQYAESMVYKVYADATVGMLIAILKAEKIGTVLEIGTGPGKLAEVLCSEMIKNNISVPIVISDQALGIKTVGANLRKEYPELSISDFVWNITQDPPEELFKNLQKPVLVYERFCIPYGGYETIDRIAPIADILLLVEDFNLVDEKTAYDIIFEKIGLQFFTYQETRKYLEKHFRCIHPFEDTGAVNLPDTYFFLLSIK